MAEQQLDEAALHVQSLLLLSRVYKEQELMDRAAEALATARGMQTGLLARVRVEASDQLSSQREVLAEIYYRTALLHELLRDPAQARDRYITVTLPLLLRTGAHLIRGGGAQPLPLTLTLTLTPDP